MHPFRYVVACHSRALLCQVHRHLTIEAGAMSERGRGRGWYYKEKYGGGRRQGGADHTDDSSNEATAGPSLSNKRERLWDQSRGLPTMEEPMHCSNVDGAARPSTAGSSGVRGSVLHTPRGGVDQLREMLRRLHNKSYAAYRDVQGTWSLPNGTLVSIDHVQSDPFAPPSRCCVFVPHSVAALPSDLWQPSKTRCIALCDWLTRRFAAALRGEVSDVSCTAASTTSGGGGGYHRAKGGDIFIDEPGQYVLERTSCIISKTGVELRFTASFPAAGRTILGHQAAQLLTELVPRLAQLSLHYRPMTPADQAAASRHVLSVEDQAAARSALQSKGLVAFVADGAILPRLSGISDQPLAAPPAVPFVAPEGLQVTLQLPNAGEVSGMGIPAGITLIVGGGFHGKSTLLQALQAGVYDKVPGDGRELVVTDVTAIKIRAEDGRRVAAVDISPFINNLPGGRDTNTFTTDNASGSTSQAANIIEALEGGAKTLLLDEDTCASNFMLRDALMAAFLPRDLEPITPFLTRVRSLSTAGVSSILVVGGSGEYFRVADTVVAMAHFRASDATARARELIQRMGGGPEGAMAIGAPATTAAAMFTKVVQRTPTGILPVGSGSAGIKVRARTVHVLQLQDEQVDLAGVEGLVETSQTRAVGQALRWMQHQTGSTSRLSLRELGALLDAELDACGLDALAPYPHSGDLARPRVAEVLAALNRVRTLRAVQLRL